MTSSLGSISDSRVWFNTGSSQGLGKALLDTVLAAGDRVVATLRNPSALSHLESKYPASQLLIWPLDVTSASQINDAFEATKTHFNHLDVVVNNAGYGLLAEIEATPDEEARKIMEVLYWGPVNITKHAIKFFREVNPPGHGGRVFNVSSVGGYQANPNVAFYSSGKFALEGFTECFIKEMPPAWNIKGCIIEPGGFRTEWSRGSLIKLPQHPAYTDPSFPTSRSRAARESTIQIIGDPMRAAHVILKLAEEPNLPLRLQLGSDAFSLVQGQARKTLSDQQKWQAVSHSTNADDHDNDVLKNVVGAVY